jgi:hypothetical protein
VLTSSIISVTSPVREPSPVLPGFSPSRVRFPGSYLLFCNPIGCYRLVLSFSLSHMQSLGKDAAHEECVGARGRR